MVSSYLHPVEAKATEPNQEPRIAFLEDLGLPPASTSFSPPEPRIGQFQALQSINSPLLDVPSVSPVVQAVPPKVYSPYPESCLKSVQYWIKEFPKGVGIPNNVQPTHFYPKVGDAILTTESRSAKYPTGHTGEVLAVDPMVSVTFKECNYSGYRKDGVWIPTCGIRTLPLNAEQIRGYWDKDLQINQEYAILGL